MSIMSMLDKHYFREQQQQVKLGSKENLFTSNIDAEALPIKPGIGDGVRTFQELIEIRLREHQDSPRLKNFNNHLKESQRTDENATETVRFQTPSNKKKIVFTDRFASSVKNNNAQRTFLKKGEGLKKFAGFKVPIIAPKSISRRQTFVKFKVDGSATQYSDTSQEQSSYHESDAVSIASDDPKTESSYLANEPTSVVSQTPRLALKSLQGNTKTSQPSVVDKCFVRKVKSIDPLPKDAMISFRKSENNTKVTNAKAKQALSIPDTNPTTLLKKSNSLVTINEISASTEIIKDDETPESNPETPKPRYNLRGSRKTNQPIVQKSEEVIVKTRGRKCKKQSANAVENSAKSSNPTDLDQNTSTTMSQKCNQSYSDSQINEEHLNDLLDRIEQKKSTLKTNAHKPINAIVPHDDCIAPARRPLKTKPKKKVYKKNLNSELTDDLQSSNLESRYDNADDYTSSCSSGDWDRDSSEDGVGETKLHRGLASPKPGGSYIAFGRQIDRIQKSVDELQRLPIRCECGRVLHADGKAPPFKTPSNSSNKDSEVLNALQKQIDELRKQIAQTKVG